MRQKTQPNQNFPQKTYSTIWMHYQDTVEDVAAFLGRKNRAKVLRNKCLEISW